MRRESKTISEKDVRQVQDHQTPRRRPGDLRKPEAQAAPGI